MDSNKPYFIERIVAALSYPTMGLIGFVWLILGLFTNAKLRPFMQYHIFQSIFISIALVLLNMLFAFLINIISVVPFINVLVLNIMVFLNSPVFMNYSIIQIVIALALLYLGVTAFLGKYTYIPYVSEIIDQNVRH